MTLSEFVSQYCMVPVKAPKDHPMYAFVSSAIQPVNSFIDCWTGKPAPFASSQTDNPQTLINELSDPRAASFEFWVGPIGSTWTRLLPGDGPFTQGDFLAKLKAAFPQ